LRAACHPPRITSLQAEFKLLDGFEGIKPGSDPYSKDFRVNRYARTWVEVELPDWTGETNGMSSMVTEAIAYVRNKTLWEGYPSDRQVAVGSAKHAMCGCQ
jgi:hypothetical protein